MEHAYTCKTCKKQISTHLYCNKKHYMDKHIHTHNQPNKDQFEKPEKNRLQHIFTVTQNRTKKNTHTLTHVSTHTHTCIHTHTHSTPTHTHIKHAHPYPKRPHNQQHCIHRCSQGYSSCALTSTMRIMGLLFCRFLVGLREKAGPDSSPSSTRSSAEIRGHFSAFSSSTEMGSMDCRHSSGLDCEVHPLGVHWEDCQLAGMSQACTHMCTFMHMWLRVHVRACVCVCVRVRVCVYICICMPMRTHTNVNCAAPTCIPDTLSWNLTS